MNQLKKDIGRNKRIVAYITEQYQVDGHYDLPPQVDRFITILNRDIDKAEAWLRGTPHK